MPETNELADVRLAKVEQLRAGGIEPYPPRLALARTHTAAEAIRAFEAAEANASNGDQPVVEVCVAGRMLSRRIMGKASFAHIEDGKIGRAHV